MRALLALMLLLTLAPIALAQDDEADPDDQVTMGRINYGETLRDSITDRSPFDRFTFFAQENDILLVAMQAEDGLAPLVGIAGSSGDVIARSDQTPDGSPLPTAQPDGVATLRYTVPASGEYTVVTSRAGLADGTTTGSYTVTLTLIGVEGTSLRSDLQPVTFLCFDVEVTTLLTLDFGAAAGTGAYRFSLYAEDGLLPVIDAVAGADGLVRDCSRDAQRMGGDTYQLPGEDPVTLADPASLPEGEELAAAQYGLRGGEVLEGIRITIAAEGAMQGRFLLVFEGLSIEAAGDTDSIDLRLGPLAIDATVDVYMVAQGRSRLDPTLRWLDGAGEQIAACDDAGRGDCDHIPAFVGAGVAFNDGLALTGDTLDAGLRLAPGSVAPQTILAAGRNPNATGDYTLFFIVTLPPAEDEG